MSKLLLNMLKLSIVMVVLLIDILALALPFVNPLWFIGSFIVIIIQYSVMATYPKELTKWITPIDDTDQ